MAIRKFKFKMTAKIVQHHIVEIDEKDVPKGQDIEDYAQEEAEATWDYTTPSDDENY
mgnify:FL=1